MYICVDPLVRTDVLTWVAADLYYCESPIRMLFTTGVQQSTPVLSELTEFHKSKIIVKHPKGFANWCLVDLFPQETI